jgi:hypothetical protein
MFFDFDYRVKMRAVSTGKQKQTACGIHETMNGASIKKTRPYGTGISCMLIVVS